jgi:hypothetical protein
MSFLGITRRATLAATAVVLVIATAGVALAAPHLGGGQSLQRRGLSALSSVARTHLAHHTRITRGELPAQAPGATPPASAEIGLAGIQATPTSSVGVGPRAAWTPGEPPPPEATPPPPEPEPAPEPEPEPAPAPAPEPEPQPEPEPEPAPQPEPEPEPSPQPQPEPPAPEPEPLPAGDGESLVIAIDGGWGGWNGAEIADRVELGAAVTRHEWDISRPVDSQDAIVLAAASEIHTRILALLGANELGDPTHYSEWVVEFIGRYGQGGSFWAQHPQLDASRYAITTVELGNEPYYGGMSAGEYANAVRPALERIQALNLPVKVVLPSNVYGEDTSWIDTLYERISDLNSMFYGFAFHPYWYGHDPASPGPGGPFARIETQRRRMNELGAAAKPILLTEYGESTASCGGECVDEAEQAEHLAAMIEAISSHLDWDVRLLSIFQLRDRGTNSPDRELQFGILRENGTAKPSYALVREAMLRYRG